MRRRSDCRIKLADIRDLGRVALVGLLSLVGAIVAHGQSGIPEIQRGEAPAWADWQDVVDPASVPASNHYYGISRLLEDRQVHVEQEAYFYHFAYQLLNPTGVQNSSSLTFRFDPTYETLTMNRLRILRGSTVIDLLDTLPAKIRQRETSLEWNLYDGTWSVEFLLEDTRPDDVIEYAFTLEGFNPILEGRFAYDQALYFPSPVAIYRLRLILPDHTVRPIFHNLETLQIEGVTSEVTADNGLIWDIQLNFVPETNHPLDGPGWFEPYPVMRFSEYPDWASVVGWALPLYSIEGPMPDMLEQEVAWMGELPDNKAKILAALRYVQDNIRYVAVFGGLHSHLPYPLQDVVRWRFGDCKDQAVMLVTLLRKMGITAWPALVNTYSQAGIYDRPPSHLAFDHVVVAVPLDESWLWLDPTMANQRGPIDQLYMPDYGYALILRPSEDQLTVMPGQGHEVVAMSTHERFILPEDPSDPVLLKVYSEYFGAEADAMRGSLAAGGPRVLQRNYLDYYENEYGDVEAEGDLEVVDDQEMNHLTVRERWLLANPWKEGGPGEISAIQFNPSTIRTELQPPTPLRPHRPIARNHPRKISHRVELVLPIDLPMEGESFAVEDDYFRFSMESKTSARLLDLNYNYQSLRSAVPEEAFASFRERVSAALDWTYYEVQHPWDYMEKWGDAGESFVPNWPLIGLALGALIAGVALGLTLSLWPVSASPRRPQLLNECPHLEGIGGWLILPILGLAFTMLYNGAYLFNEGYWNYDRDVWNETTSPQGESYHPWWEPYLLSVAICTGGVFGFTPILLIQLLRRLSVIRVVMPLFYLFLFCWSLGEWEYWSRRQEFLEPGELQDTLGQMIRTGLICLIWIPYFLFSRRVALTFSRSHSERSNSSSVPPPIIPKND
jgi:hypothetical protein